MAFRTVDLSHHVTFNSKNSSDLLDIYTSGASLEISSKSAELKSRTFAPSSFRCARKNWFRLRGAVPDILESPDLTLQFQADLGTYIHTVVQSRLQRILGDDWIDVGAYLNSIAGDLSYTYTVVKNGYESLVSIDSPPVKFACDGIIRLNGVLYLLEIKTADFKNWDSLTRPKDIHMDQVKCYSALIGIRDVLFLYVDRQTGKLKCFEEHISDADADNVVYRFGHIQKMVDANLAPERLDRSDSMCTNCEYKIKCTHWG